MIFSPDRLIRIRESLNISKSEAARRLNMSAMGYGRYEKGERVPSYQTICFIAQTFNTTPEYLCEETDMPDFDMIVLNKKDNPNLYLLVERLKNYDSNSLEEITQFIEKFSK